MAQRSMGNEVVSPLLAVAGIDALLMNMSQTVKLGE